jgi:ABC-type multidrug transport system fused ATPase/permease subunit
MIFLKKIFTLVEKKYFLSWILLILIMLISSFLEIIAFSFLVPAFNAILYKDFSKLNFLLNFIKDFDKVFIISILILLLFIFKNIFNIFLNYKLNKFTTSIQKNLQKTFFKTYLSREYEFFFKKNSSYFINNITFNIESFIIGLLNLCNLVIESLLLISIIFVLFLNNFYFTIFISIVFISCIFFSQKFSKEIFLNNGLKSEKLSVITLKFLRETFDNMREIITLNKNLLLIKKYNELSDYKSYLMFLRFFIAALPKIIIEIIAITIFIGILLFVHFSKIEFTTFIPTFGLFIIAFFKILPSVTKIISALNGIKYSKAATDVLFDEYNNLNKISINLDFYDKTPDLIFEKNVTFSKKITLEKINYSYDKNIFILKDVDLTINKGECIGIIGSSGSGKSTLFDIISCLLNPQSGKIYFDDFFLLQNHTKYWRSIISYVSQNPYLINDSIKNNIALYQDELNIDYKDLENSIKLSYLNDFLINLPNGIDTIIDEKSINVSGGQKQRIAIARAIYKKSEIYIFDEITSALDSKLEQDIKNTINSLKGNKTILIATHSENLLQICDKVYEIKDSLLKKKN